MRQVGTWAWPAAVLAIVVLAWELTVRTLHTPPYLLPAPSAIIPAGFRDRQLLRINLATTAEEVISGLLLAIAVGLVFGAAIALSSIVRRSLLPLLIAWKAVPTIAVAPLLIIWFGYTTTPRILTTALICFFPITVATADGFGSVDAQASALFTTFGANRTQRLIRLYLPSALPQILTGIKIAVPLAVIGATISEWTGAQSGLGYLILADTGALNTERVFASIALLSMIGILLYLGALTLERALLPWRHRSRRHRLRTQRD